MYTVQYLCSFQPIWRDTDSYLPFREAVQMAQSIAQQRRTRVRVLDDYGRIAWQR